MTATIDQVAESVNAIAQRVAREHGLRVGPEVAAGQLVPGARYWLKWSSYWQRVTILLLEDGSLGFRSQSGWEHSVSSIPGGRWFPVIV